ncbi:MAG TPA: NF038129 family PEP-CTERM protein [Lacunisphaera sp.]|nr:NF038129 family PEP-CTERM protein [Lacunisphaera sp.]
MILTLLGAAALAVAGRATLVTLNTSSLTAGGTYYVDFQLNNGSGGAGNSAAISGFTFGGGGVFTPTDIGLIGGAAGDLSSTVWLNDSSPFNEFFQAFTAGSSLSFDLRLSNNVDAPIPDIFGFAILDENLFNLATLSPIADQFLIVELNGSSLDFQAYAGVDGVTSPGVPESAVTAGLVAVAMAGLVGIRHRMIRTSIAA